MRATRAAKLPPYAFEKHKAFSGRLGFVCLLLLFSRLQAIVASLYAHHSAAGTRPRCQQNLSASKWIPNTFCSDLSATQSTRAAQCAHTRTPSTYNYPSFIQHILYFGCISNLSTTKLIERNVFCDWLLCCKLLCSYILCIS